MAFPLVVSADMNGPLRVAPELLLATPVPSRAKDAVQPTEAAPLSDDNVGRRPSSGPVTASAPDAEGTTSVSAMRLSGTRGVELVAEGDVALSRDDLLLTADRLTYQEPRDEVVAEGSVRLSQGSNEITGPRARLVVDARTGEFEQPRYRISRAREADEAPLTGQGSADVLRFEGRDRYRLSNATWSSCPAPDPDWYLRAADIELDYSKDEGVVRNGTLVFGDTPTLWLPWADFPLSDRRRSGVLAPTIGTSNTTGFDLSVPYYVNLAPNYDLTLTPRYMTRRGLQLGSEFRYLADSFNGELRAEWLPSDLVAGRSRSLGAWRHEQRFGSRLGLSIDLNAVSDNDYFEDLSARVAIASKVNLLRQAQLHYQGDHWSAFALAQRYQTLSGEEPYRRLPQLGFDWRRDLANDALPAPLTLALRTRWTDFDIGDEGRAAGRRLVFNPSVALPLRRAGWHLMPELSWHATRYELDRPASPDGRRSIARSLPMFSVDAGLEFERAVSFGGGNYVQTLEPRLLYVFAPSRAQDDLPVFDTSRLEFGFAQMFNPRAYTGDDRVADADQLTVAVVSQLIDRDSGMQRLRLALGQRYYFRNQSVALPGEPLREDARTDVLFAADGQLGAQWRFDTAWQYNPRDVRTERYGVSMQWQPGHARVLNAGYRYTRGVLHDLDLSAQWPLGGRWFGVARVTRSVFSDRLTEALGGIEYDGGCWVLRAVAHRFATTDDNATQALFVQLELNGLAAIGANPVGLLRRGVSGYGKINEPASGRIFGTE